MSPKIIPTATFLKGDVLAVLEKLPKAKYDLIVTSPPYNIGKIYERSTKLTFEQYIEWLDKVIGKLVDAVQDHGSICWQVGSFIKDGEVFPIDIHTYDSFKRRGMKLRNRIIWRFNFGLHSKRRLSGRYETILWFTKSDDHRFNLDAVRVPQLYPGKRHSKKRTRSGNFIDATTTDCLSETHQAYWAALARCCSASQRFITSSNGSTSPRRIPSSAIFL